MQPAALRTVAIADDTAVVAALRRDDEAAFTALVNAYSASLLRLAQDFVRTRALAEEVVQEAWLAVMREIDRFEARTSLKTWIYGILVNKRSSPPGIRTTSFSSAGRR